MRYCRDTAVSRSISPVSHQYLTGEILVRYCRDIAVSRQYLASFLTISVVSRSIPPFLAVPGQYLASISPVSRQYLASISPASRQLLASISPVLRSISLVSRQYLANISPVPRQYLAVSRQFLTSMSPVSRSISQYSQYLAVSRQYLASISPVSRSISPVSRQYLANISPVSRVHSRTPDHLLNARQTKEATALHLAVATGKAQLVRVPPPMQARRVGGGEGQGRTGRELVADGLAMQGGDEGKGGGGFP